MLNDMKGLLNNAPDLKGAIRKAIEENAGLKKQIEEYMAEKLVQYRDRLINLAVEENGVKIVKLDGEANNTMIRNVLPLLRGKFTDMKFALVAATHEAGKRQIAVFRSQPLVDAGKNAGAMIKAAAKNIQGGGGGQPWMATAGGRDVNGLSAAMEELLKGLA